MLHIYTLNKSRDEQVGSHLYQKQQQGSKAHKHTNRGREGRREEKKRKNLQLNSNNSGMREEVFISY